MECSQIVVPLNGPDNGFPVVIVDGDDWDDDPGAGRLAYKHIGKIGRALQGCLVIFPLCDVHAVPAGSCELHALRAGEDGHVSVIELGIDGT